MSFLSDLINAVSPAAAEYYNYKNKQRRDDWEFEKDQRRALNTEEERRNRALKYGEEDYGIAQKREGELYKKTQTRKGDEIERLIGIAKDLGNQTNDNEYVPEAIAKIEGLPALKNETDVLRRDVLINQANYWKNRGTGKGGSTSGSAPEIGDAYKRRKMVSEEMERLMKTLQVGRGLDEFGNPSGVPLSKAQERILIDELTSLQGEYSNLSQSIQRAGQTDGANPMQTLMEGFVKIFGGDEAENAQSVKSTAATSPALIPGNPPGVVAQTKALNGPVPSKETSVAPPQPRYEELFSGIRYDSNAPVLRFLRELIASADSAAKSGKKLPPLPFGYTNAFSGSLPGRSY